ncbi:MAG: NERD domain-containing protein [Chloroflexi bacterium]|nr:NERD domain-containing protein [Chloroflexota bacterium]
MRSLTLSHGRAVAAASHATGVPTTDRIALWFDGVLDNTYAAVRNVTLPNAETAIDMIVIGPPGIWAIYVETDSGQYKIEGNNFLAWDSAVRRYVALSPNPLEHLLYNEAQLRGWLNAAGLPPNSAHSVILFTDNDARVDSSNDAVRLIGPNDISTYPMEIARQPAILDEAAIERAFAAISRGELPEMPAPRLKPPARPGGFEPRQWAVLAALALLNICVLGGACALVAYLNR